MNNPLIYRGLCSALRPRKVVLTAVAVALVVLVAWGVLHTRWEQEQATRQAQRHLAPDQRHPAPEPYAESVIRPLGMVVLGLQYIIGFALVPAVCIDALPTERLRKSEEFFTTLPTSPIGKTVGLLVGPNVMHLVLMALLTAPVSGLLLDGGVSPGPIVWTQVLLWSGAVSLALVGLLLSQALGAWRGGWLLVLFLVGVGASLTFVFLESDFAGFPLMAYVPTALAARCLTTFEEPSAQRTWFFIWSMPWQISPLVVHVLVGVSCFAATAQRLRRPCGPPLPRWATLLVFAAAHLVLVGFLAEDWRRVSGTLGGSGSAMGAYAGCWFVLLFAWSALRAPRLQDAMEWLSSRGDHWPGRLLSESLTDPRVPGHIATLLGWGMTVGALAVVDAVYWGGIVYWTHALAAFTAIGLFLMGYQSVVLFGSLGAKRWGASLGLVVAVLSVVIPLGFASAAAGDGDPLIVTPLHRSLHFRTEARTPHLRWPEQLNVSLVVATSFVVLGGVAIAVRLASLRGRLARRREAAEFGPA